VTNSYLDRRIVGHRRDIRGQHNPNVSDPRLFAYLAETTPSARASIRDAQEFDSEFYPGFDAWHLSLLVEMARPDMPSIYPGKRLNGTGKRARSMLVTRWDQIEAASIDPILEKLKEMAPFVDAGWDTTSVYRPSEIIILRYFICVSDRENPDRADSMKKQAIAWIDEGRRRWQRGFSADPIGMPKARLASVDRTADAGRKAVQP